MRTLHFLICLPIALAPFLMSAKPDDKAAPAPAAATVVPAPVLAPLEGIIKQLAKGAREREMKDLLSALEKIGYPKANFEKLEKLALDDLAKAKTPIDSLPAGAKQLRVTAAQLVPIMEKIEDEQAKKDFARKILLLDGECAAVHTFLGHEKVGNTWVRSEFKTLRERRGEILRKVEEAKRLEVDMETEENVDDEHIEKACGVKATVVRRGNMELRSNFSVEKTQRIMREAQRALALSDWLRNTKGGELKLRKAGPSMNRGVEVMIDSREMYMKYAAELAAADRLDPEDKRAMEIPNTQLASFNLKDDTQMVLRMAQWEASTTCAIFVRYSGMEDMLPTPLSVGLLNWVALSCFGTTMPNYIVTEPTRRGMGDTKVAGEDREREELMRLAKSGIAGSRTWMQFLAERGEDPSFGNSLVNSFGEVRGNDLHKCTSIAEFLMESNTFGTIYKAVLKKADGGPVNRYTAAMEMQFGELESKWRDWLLGVRPGVAERIDKENLAAWPKDALRVLDYMNEIRENAFKDKIKGVWKLKFDPDLSAPCDMHAKYLVLHPEQKKWPDAHEEYADKEGYTVEGAWAGTHSVIAWGGIEDYKDSIDGWMGTFYHRLPLLDPGVLRLGWGQAGEWWVMDMSSLAAPYEEQYLVLWPYDGQKDVPTAFNGNEYPDPVPEKGQDVNEGEIFGYPITIQTKPIDEKGELVDISMKLFEGDREVECHFSSPEKPSNPESAPAGAWCLIPKTFLKSKAEYRVVADWHNSNKKTTSVGKRVEWKFKTE